MINCRVCNTSTLRVYDILKSEDNQQRTTVYCCTECHTLFIDPIPYNYQSEENLINYYLPIRDPLMTRYNSVFKYVNNLGKKGKFLDIGCGIGYSLLVAQDWKWEGVGIEPNPYLSNYSRSKFGLNIVNDFFNIQDFPENSFAAGGRFPS